MLDLLVVALFQAAIGEPAPPATDGPGVTVEEVLPAEEAAPDAATPDTIPEQIAPAEPQYRTERVCRRERSGGASRTARALVCRDVQVEVTPPAQPTPQ